MDRHLYNNRFTKIAYTDWITEESLTISAEEINNLKDPIHKKHILEEETKH